MTRPGAPAPRASSRAGSRVGTALRRTRGANNEGLVAVAIVVVVVIVGAVRPSFWSLYTVFNVLQNLYEPLIFALGFLLVLLTGGIDVSFDAIGIFAGYLTATAIAHRVTGGNFAVAFVMAALIGLCLGAVNAAVVSLFRLPTLIVTLGTRAIFAGALLGYVGTNYVGLPHNLATFGSDVLVTTRQSSHSAGLQVLIIPVAVLCVLIALGTRYTILGRGLYAVGGNAEAARRSGFSVGRVRTVAFCAAGLLAGLAGMVHVTLTGYADPTDIVGNELIVIAAVVLGGASIVGGRGSVLGTVLGTLLIVLIEYSLIVLGIQSSWDNVAVGAFLFLGLVVQLAGRRGAMSALVRRLQVRRPLRAEERQA